jgi:hypothetical protein
MHANALYCSIPLAGSEAIRQLTQLTQHHPYWQFSHLCRRQALWQFHRLWPLRHLLQLHRFNTLALWAASLSLKLASILYAAPYLAIAAILFHWQVRRAVWMRRKRLRKRSLGFCPSASALGFALLFLQVFFRPSLEHVLAERQNEEADEDEEGDPEGPKKQLSRQLKRIRRGERVDRLVLRL